VAVYVDDRLFQHPKLRRAGDLVKPYGRARALMLYLSSVQYARTYLTDGFLPAEFLAGYGDDPAPVKLAEALVDVHLWHRDGAGYRIHDFHEFNDPADVVKQHRAANRDRVAKWRATHPPRRGGNGRA
jgi:hypothetical protein